MKSFCNTHDQILVLVDDLWIEFQGAVYGFVVGWDIFLNASVISISSRASYVNLPVTALMCATSLTLGISENGRFGYVTVPEAGYDTQITCFVYQQILQIVLMYALLQLFLLKVGMKQQVVLYILESNPHPFYSFRAKKSDVDQNHVQIRFAVESWIL